MTDRISKNLINTLLMSVSIGFSVTTYAHDSGAQALGAAAGATDVFAVFCSDDGSGPTSYLQYQIQETSGKNTTSPLVSMQTISSTGKTFYNTTDPVNGDAGFSPWVYAYGPNGTFYIIVDKTAANAITYDFTYHCMTAENEHTGTDIQKLQDQ